MSQLTTSTMNHAALVNLKLRILLHDDLLVAFLCRYSFFRICCAKHGNNIYTYVCALLVCVVLLLGPVNYSGSVMPSSDQLSIKRKTPGHKHRKIYIKEKSDIRFEPMQFMPLGNIKK